MTQRFLVLLAVALGCSVPLEAQRRIGRAVRRAFDYRAVEVGVVGGPNRSTMVGGGSFDARFKGLLGGFVSVRLAEGLRLRPEVLISGKDVAATDQVVPPCLPPGPCPALYLTETTRLTWLEAPLLIEYRFDDVLGSNLAPKVYAGPFLALRLGCSLSSPVSPTPNPDPGDTQRLVQGCDTAGRTASRFNNGDGGFVIGAGIGTGPVGLGFRWIRSLTKVGQTNRFLGARQSTVALTLEFSTRLW